MKRLPVVAFSTLMLLACQAIAAHAVPQSSVNRRLLNGCMTKQMAASRTISYNEATRVCKDQIKSHNDGLSANNEAKPANAR